MMFNKENDILKRLEEARRESQQAEQTSNSNQSILPQIQALSGSAIQQDLSNPELTDEQKSNSIMDTLSNVMTGQQPVPFEAPSKVVEPQEMISAEEEAPAETEEKIQDNPTTGDVSDTIGTSQSAPSRYEEIINELRAMREQNQRDVDNARGLDARSALMNQMNNAFSQLNTSIANRAGITNIKPTTTKSESQFGKQAEGDRDNRIKSLMDEYRLLNAKEQADENRKVREDAAKAAAEDRRLRREERTSKVSSDKNIRALEAFNKDPETRKLRERQGMASNAESLLSMRNPIADEAVGTQLARMAGEVGNLTEQDIARFNGSKALHEWARKQTSKMLTGRIDDNNRRYLEEMVKVFKEANADTEMKSAKRFSNQYGKAYGMNPEDIQEVLTPGYLTQPSQQSTPNEVRRITSDGRTAIFDSETKQFLRYEG